jgi:hypothetical protein
MESIKPMKNIQISLQIIFLFIFDKYVLIYLIPLNVFLDLTYGFIKCYTKHTIYVKTNPKENDKAKPNINLKLLKKIY